MFLGYNTNGFAFHRLDDAIDVIADLGYEGVAITVEHYALNPFEAEAPAERAAIRAQLHRHRLAAVIETGARFLLDPKRKHQPTLVSAEPAERQRRIDFLIRCVQIAADLEQPIVSFWSGTPAEAVSPNEIERRLEQSIEPLVREAERRGVRLALEPEPGMAVATVRQGIDLIERIGHPALKLTVDVGHVHCQREGSMADILNAAGKLVANVHIEDMRRDVHDHLMFGEGEIDFAEVFAGLKAIAYGGGLYVELSRHAHNAVEVACSAHEFLQRFQR